MLEVDPDPSSPITLTASKLDKIQQGVTLYERGTHVAFLATPNTEPPMVPATCVPSTIISITIQA